MKKIVIALAVMVSFVCCAQTWFETGFGKEGVSTGGAWSADEAGVSSAPVWEDAALALEDVKDPVFFVAEESRCADEAMVVFSNSVVFCGFDSLPAIRLGAKAAICALWAGNFYVVGYDVEGATNKWVDTGVEAVLDSAVKVVVTVKGEEAVYRFGEAESCEVAIKDNVFQKVGYSGNGSVTRLSAAANQYVTLTIAAVENCTITVSNVEVAVESGATFDKDLATELTVYRTPAEGYRLADGCEAVETVTMSDDVEVTATVVPVVAVDFSNAEVEGLEVSYEPADATADVGAEITATYSDGEKIGSGTAVYVVQSDGTLVLKEDESKPEAKEAAAKIGTALYLTLADALDAAAEGEAVTLLADVDLAESVKITKKIVIDLGAKEVKFAGCDGFYIVGTDVAISNGTITMDVSSEANKLSPINFEDSDGLIKDVVVNAGGCKYGVTGCSDGENFNEKTVVCENVDVTGSGVLFYAETMMMTLDADCSAVQTGVNAAGEIYSGALAAGWLGVLEVAGGSYTADKNAVATMSSPATIRLVDGVFAGAFTVTPVSEGYKAMGDHLIEISGGDFSDTGIPVSYIKVGEGDVASWVASEAEGYVTPSVTVAVAKVGATRFFSLAGALAAAESGATVTLLADASGDGIQINKPVTVDFGGFTYTADGEPTGSAGTKNQVFQLLPGNTVVFSNGTIAVDESVQDKYRFIIQNYSDLTLDGVTLDGSKLAFAGKTRYTLSNNNGTTTLKGGTTVVTSGEGQFAMDTFDSMGYEGIPTVVIEDATIKGDVELSGGSLTLTVGTLEGALVDGGIGEGVVTKAETFEAAAPADYKWDDEGRLVAVEYATLTITAVENCTIVVSNETEEVTTGATFDKDLATELTVYRTPAEGYRLADGCEAVETVTMSDDVEVTATVEEIEVITGTWFTAGFGEGAEALGGAWAEAEAGVSAAPQWDGKTLVVADSEDPVVFRADETKPAAGAVATFRTTVGFEAFDAVPAIDGEAKMGICALTDGNYMVVGFDAVGETNMWVDSGITAKFGDLVDVTVTVSNNVVTYTFDGTEFEVGVRATEFKEFCYTGVAKVTSLIADYTTYELPYPSYIPQDNADAKEMFDVWATEKNGGDRDGAAELFDAFLLNCAPADVETEAAAFEITSISHDAESDKWVCTVTGGKGEGDEYGNGYVRFVSVKAEKFAESAEDADFFQATLTLTPVNDEK